MNCPCCGNEMKVGFLGSGQPIVWTPNKEKWIRLPAEDRFPVACEGDVGGLVMMDLMQKFTGNMAFQAEWGQFDMANNALFLLGHGIGTPALAAGNDKITLPSSIVPTGFQFNQNHRFNRWFAPPL